MNQNKRLYKSKRMGSIAVKNKLSGYEFLAIISSMGICFWISTDFFGGMILFLFGYVIVILPILILYIISFCDTSVSLIVKGSKTSRVKLIAHGIVALIIIVFNIYHSELLKSEKIMTARLDDDLYYFQLVFRNDGEVENKINGMFGYSEIFYGKYKIEDNLIVFTKKPYDNSFIPDTLLIDKSQGALFLHKGRNGEFNTKKEWLNHFKIE